MNLDTCPVHNTPLTRTDDLPSAEQPQGRHWRCLADGDRCTTSYGEPAGTTGAALGVGDRICVVSEGVHHELVVTSEPELGADGTVTFTAADPEAHEQAERLRPWLELTPEHRVAKTRTDEERAALAHLSDGQVPAEVVDWFGADFAARINATGMPQ